MLQAANLWQGFLTLETGDLIVDTVRSSLLGKKYAFIEANENFQFCPRMRTEQRIKSINLIRHTKKHIQIIIADSFGVASISSVSDNKNPHISINSNMIIMTQYLSDDKLCHWIYIIQT